MIVHQVFGLFADNPQMPLMFYQNSKKYIEWCKGNDYQYILWDENMCKELLDEYPDYKEMYYSVKYPIMKVDIVRFLILHKCGGLYADLDTTPNIIKCKDDDFIVGYLNTQKPFYEMEIIQSKKNNPLLLEFLDYAKTQIIEKDKEEIYDKWKCRYVYQTTGPRALTRFLKGKEVSKYIINHADEKSQNIKGNEDFHSYHSCSYYDNTHNLNPEIRFAIPSYNRLKELGEKTLATLAHHNIPKRVIDIFCVKEEIDEYRKLYPEYNIIEAPKGMVEVRRFIFREHYNEGAWIVSMDDDIEKIRMKNPREWEESSFCDDELDLMKEIELAFDCCVKSNRKLWGVNCMDSHFYMKNTITYDYKFCVGYFWGLINDYEIMDLSLGMIEDYERSIRSYMKCGGNVRLNYLCCKTKFLKNKGGANSEEFNRKIVMEEQKHKLVEMYPNLVRLKEKKNYGLNPVLKDYSKVKSK